VIDRDFAALQAVAADSRLWRSALAIGRVLERSWSDSRAASALTRLTRSTAAMPVGQRIRASALTIAWAAAGYGASLWIAPPYVRSGIPLPAILAVSLIALIVAIGAEGFAKSWRHSSIREALRK
jgi:hypothetical protein